MNKILVVVSFVFVSFLSCTGLTDRQRLANQILSDTNLLKVDSMARARRVIHTNCGKLFYCFSLFNSRMMR